VAVAAFRVFLRSTSAGAVFFGLVLAVMVAVGLPGALGYGLAALCAKRRWFKRTVAEVVAWCNLGAWALIPILASLLSGATYRFAGVYRERSTRYYILASVGLILTLVVSVMLYLRRTR
jgi:hypothetical protein